VVFQGNIQRVGKLKRLLSTIYNSSPKKVIRYLGRKIGGTGERGIQKKADEISLELNEKFDFYRTSNLSGIEPEEFRGSIQSRIGKEDSQIEGFSDDELDRQRDMTIKFHWGHDHDFGDFKMEGMMGDRHIRLLSNFASLFPINLAEFEDKDVFDVGCWTGGTTLLMASISKSVFAIEEVKKYADTVQFLSDSFGMGDKVEVNSMSIYDCNSEEFFDRFDVVYFPGVIYHLSDPLLALRILFNSLKVGGTILIESAGINSDEPNCRFDGSLVWTSGTRERMNRSGWNWFWPSPSALYRMMMEAGFDEIETKWFYGTERVYGFGKKLSQVPVCKAGISVPSIR